MSKENRERLKGQENIFVRKSEWCLTTEPLPKKRHYLYLCLRATSWLLKNILVGGDKTSISKRQGRRWDSLNIRQHKRLRYWLANKEHDFSLDFTRKRLGRLRRWNETSCAASKNFTKCPQLSSNSFSFVNENYHKSFAFVLTDGKYLFKYILCSISLIHSRLVWEWRV